MRLFELFELFEAKPKKEIKPPKPRDFYAKAVTRKSGAGSHTSKGYQRQPKHKGKESED